MEYVKELIQISLFLNIMMEDRQDRRRLSVKTDIKPQQIQLNRTVQPNSQSFAELRLCTLMIDKSMLLKQISEKVGGTIITRPRRWGKTVNMDMIACFFGFPLKQDGSLNKPQRQYHKTLFVGDQYISQSKDLNKEQKQKYNQLLKQGRGEQLKPLKIVLNTKLISSHFAQYIILKMNFVMRWKIQQNLRNFYIEFLKKIKQLYHQHKYLSKNNDSQYIQTYELLQKLTKQGTQSDPSQQMSYYIKPLINNLYNFHEKKIIVLIDEYDFPYNHYMKNIQNAGYSEKANEIAMQISNFLSSFVKGWPNKIISKLICTGIRNIIMKQGDSDVNAFSYQTVDFCPSTHPYYGFTKHEIQTELLGYMFENQEKLVQTTLNIIEKNYNGYQIGKSQIYNPYSVTNYLCTISKNKHIQYVEQEIQEHLCFWIELGSGQDLFFFYLTYLTSENLRLIVKILQSVILRQQFVQISTTISGFKRHIKNRKRDILQFSYQEAIHYLITTGYLTYKDKKISIPNLEVRTFFFKDIPKYFNILFNQYLSNEDRYNFDISQWDTCEKILSNTLSQALKRFLNINQALMSALTLLEFYVLLKDKYMMIYEKNFHKDMVPDIIFVPQRQRSRIAVIHQHKIKNLDKKHKDIPIQSIQMKLQQAVFQIFNKGYFKILFQEEYKQFYWESLILRGLVGFYNHQSEKFQFKTKEYHYSREDILIFCQYNRLKLNKNAKNIEEFVIPKTNKFRNINIKETFEFFNILKDSFRPQIFLRNYGILKMAKDSWQYHLKAKLEDQNGKFFQSINSSFCFQTICCEIYLRFYGQHQITAQSLMEQLQRMIVEDSSIKNTISAFPPDQDGKQLFINWGSKFILQVLQLPQAPINFQTFIDEFEMLIRQRKNRSKHDKLEEMFKKC